MTESYVDREGDAMQAGDVHAEAMARRGQRPYTLRYETNTRVVTDHVSARVLTEAYERVPVLETRVAQLEAVAAAVKRLGIPIPDSKYNGFPGEWECRHCGATWEYKNRERHMPDCAGVVLRAALEAVDGNN